MFLFLDDTSNRGSDAGLGVGQDLVSAADQEFFSDDQPQEFQTGQVQDRQALIKQAQQNRNQETQTPTPTKSSQTNKTSKLNSQNPDSDNIQSSTTGKTQSHQRALQLAKSVGNKLKAGRDKAKTPNTTDVSNKESDKESNNEKSDDSKPGLDKAKLIHDATHNDPRKVIGDLADHYLRLGRKAGHALFLLWGILTIITLPTIIGGLISLAMFNLLLVSPNTNFRLTRWALEGLLDWFGIGEVLTVVAQFGITKIDVTISDLERSGIVVFDVFLSLIFFLIFIFTIALFCFPLQGTSGTIVSIYAWFNNLSFLKDLQGFCKLQ